MITQEQIEKAAFEYAGQIAETDKRLLYAEDFIAGVQWALEQDQWIDCNKALPDFNFPVLVISTDRLFAIAKYHQDVDSWEIYGYNHPKFRVSHWQHLNDPKK